MEGKPCPQRVARYSYRQVSHETQKKFIHNIKALSSLLYRRLKFRVCESDTKSHSCNICLNVCFYAAPGNGGILCLSSVLQSFCHSLCPAHIVGSCQKQKPSFHHYRSCAYKNVSNYRLISIFANFVTQS